MSDIKLNPQDVLHGLDNRQHRPKRRKQSYWERVNLVKSSDKYRKHGVESKREKLELTMGYKSFDLGSKLFKTKTKNFKSTHGSGQVVHFGDIVAQQKKAS